MLTQPEREAQLWKFREERAEIEQQYISRGQADSEIEQKGTFLRASIHTVF